jgi:hypothetical protein
MFFVYVDCKPDGTPFYIGKGNMRRIKDNRKRNNHHTNVCSKYPDWYRGIAFMGSEKEALAKEVELIAKYRDIVVNLTAGGEGAAGLVKNALWRARLSESSKKKWLNPEYKAGMSRKIKESHSRPETRLKMQIAGKKKDMSKSALAPYICVDCGKVSNSRGINYHQKSTNCVGKVRL